MKRHIIAAVIFILVISGLIVFERVTKTKTIPKPTVTPQIAATVPAVNNTKPALSPSGSNAQKAEGLSKEWLALFAALLSSGIAFGGVWITNRTGNKRFQDQLEHERSMEQSKIKREKLEELYVELSKYYKYFYILSFYHKSLIKHKISLEKWANRIVKHEATFDIIRLEMLIDLYCPELYLEFKKTNSAISALRCFEKNISEYIEKNEFTDFPDGLEKYDDEISVSSKQVRSFLDIIKNTIATSIHNSLQ